MSIYTTEIRFICETLSGLDESVGYSNVDEVIANSHGKIFDFNYPIFDSAYKSPLECKILKHYYTREICAETVGLWKLWLSARMNEIMPYYNELYKTALLEFNPLYTFDLYKKGNKDGSGDSAGENSNTNTNNRTNNSEQEYANNSWDKYSDTPQGAVTGVANDTYLTNARNNTDNSTLKISGTQVDEGENKGYNKKEYKTSEEYAEHIYGKNDSRSYSELIIEFRKAIINVDMLIINDLSDLFFNLW